jgi:glutathione S-transferase
MKLYTGPISLFSAKVRIALDEKGLVPDEHVSVRWSFAQRYQPHHPDVVRLNPRRQVPILIDGDAVIRDSTVICEYLEETRPEPALMPRTPAARARCRTLEAFADEVFFPSLWDLIDGAFYPSGSDAPRDTRRVDAARARIAALHAELDGELAGREYLCDAFSLADIANVVMLSAAASMGAPPDPMRAHLAGWLARTLARPAIARELAAMQAFVASQSAADTGRARATA